MARTRSSLATRASRPLPGKVVVLDKRRQAPVIIKWRQSPFLAIRGCGIKLADKIHEALVRHSQQGRVIEYLARDSTAIEARQHLAGDNDKTPLGAKAAKRQAKGKKKARKNGPDPPSKACERGTRLERQQHMKLP